MAWQVNRKTRALVIHPGRIDDMGDLLAIARAKGQELLHAKVRVHPIAKLIDGWFVVLVTPNEVGCTDAQGYGKDDVGT